MACFSLLHRLRRGHLRVVVGVLARTLLLLKRPKIVEIILLVTGLLPVLFGYSVVISDAIASSLPSQSFLPAKLCLVSFLATLMAFSGWGGALVCAWIARGICGQSDASRAGPPHLCRMLSKGTKR
jgi:hypothetical protein